ncbi:UNVERIFIED_CONTAM: hypothetical protein H355_008850 [Colinus virginianus]|nr:hypothetical protein H355_008850 [Colinus virginianus]
MGRRLRSKGRAKDLTYLQQWLEAFVMNFEKVIAVPSLEPRRPEEAVSEIPVLPREVLQVLSQRLAQCVGQGPRLGQALLLLKFFIIICRNLENVQTDKTPGFIPEVLALLRICASKLRCGQEDGAQLESVMLYALHLCECLFDPYQTWRRQLSGEVVSMKEKSKYKFAPAALPPEFNIFFQECFQPGGQLPDELQLRLIHLFGAILSGSKSNALQAITPAALEVLLAVHALHASSPGPVPLRVLLDGYFRVLNADPTAVAPEAAGGLIALRVQMLDAIPAMLRCDDRPVLQAVFLSNNCFEHIIRLLQNSKLYLNSPQDIGEAYNELSVQPPASNGLQQVFDGGSDAIAVQAISVLTAIMSNSPSAKEVFKERIGYAHLYEVLRSQGQPTQRLLQELLNMAVEALACQPALPPACSENLLELLRYFDLTPGMAGIMVPAVQKWPGGAFAFHAWLCLSEEEFGPPARPKRRQLYSFFTASGTGFEAFFTTDGMLVVAVCTKKDYMTVALPEVAFNDSAWHCVDIVHVAGRRPFGQNVVSIYADGHLRKTAQLRFPSLHESFPAALGPHAWTPLQPPTEGVVATTAAGSQDTEWGTPTSLEGHLGSVAIFCEVLQQTHVKALFCLGPNIASPFTLEGDLVELSSKLLLYYTPQDVVNCVGGMGVLLPLLEQVVTKKEEAEDEQETNDLVGPELTSSRNAQGMLIPLGRSSESRLERNSVAAFLLLVKNFIRNHPVNQESLVQCHGPAIIGALLQKVSSPLLDMSTLMASQILMEQVASEGSGLLLHLLYQHLLFDFRIWSNSDFAVRLGHIQYLASVVKDHKQRIRKKYGVQYILDSIRTYYGSFSGDEMQSLLNYVAAAQDEQQVCGALEVMHSLLKSSPSQEQLFAFLFEPGHVEVLFSLLVQKKFSDEVRERVFKVLYKMLKYEKVPERCKSRLKLKDIGYQGLIACLSDIPSSMLLFRCLSEQVLGADPPNYKDLVAVVYLSHRADLTVRLDICRKLFHLIYAQQDMESYESRQHSLSHSGSGGCLELLRFADHPSKETEEVDVFLPLGYEASDQELSEGFSDHSISPNGRTKSFHCYNFKSFDSSDRASRSSSNPGDVPLDGVYHPLSPFSTSPFDLGLDLASTSSIATAESGAQTPASGPGTPSPLESFKPFPGMRNRKSSSLSNVLDESSYQDALPSDNISNTSNPQQTPEEELCNLLTNIIFSVTWRGVEGWDDAAWRERGQVFSVLTKLGTACELIYEGVSSLLDKLGVWYHLDNGTSDLKEMAQTGLRILVGYILLQDPQLHSLAYVKLHSLLQTATAPKRDEACYLLGKLETPLQRSLDAKSETFSWLVPIVRTLMDRCYETLQLQQFLPSLPPTNGSPTFYEDFQQFCTTLEWRSFIEKHVQPTMAQFEMDTFARSHDHMSNFWNACYDAMMSSSLRRERDKADSRKMFQELVLEPVAKRTKAENARHANVLKQANNHHSTVLKQWRSLCRLLTSPRSAWADRNPPEVRWKLSSAETYSRMRLKLVPNLNFDQHLEASALRDNLGADNLHNPAESLPLAMAKEAKVSELEDDQLAEEDLPVLDIQAEPKEQNQREKLVVSEDCELITTVAVVPGRLEVTTQHIYFYDGSSEKEETEGGIGYDFKRPLSHLREVHLRRYNLRRSALELFFIDQANYFLNFKKKVRNKVYSCILGLRPPNQIYFGSRSPQELLKASGLTQKWVLREISNFEYLMQLNTIAGRTYNDLSQYPVFPWILRDYVSETLDLTNPSVFRDLSKPIGVANERHARDVKEKYESFEDPTGTVDKFHYGTHYSNAAGVMHYLIRTEPFTTLHIQLQSGRFDCSDRQFHSVPAAWQARMENPVDVKELIPEFFYFPEFLENQNGFDLGCLQMSNEKVSHVVLPRWARSREDFIYQHRKALESEYVSAHLHEWIDLIFGYKQRGPAAVEALNVFYYCTYEGAVDLDAIADETQRKALEGIISNFGQTPCQLLKEPHPARMSAESAARRLARLDTRPPNVFENLDQLKSFFVEGISDGVSLVQAVVPKNQAHSFITQGSPDVLVTVSANGLLGTHSWLPYDKNISNYFSFTKDPTVSNTKTQRFLQGPFAPGADLCSRTLAVSPDGKLLFSGGHWDNSLRVTSLGKGKVIGHITRHIDVVTCLALDLCGIYLISGSRDTTCMVWQVLQQGGFSSGLAPKPIQVLYGHDDEVTCVAISTELDMAVSGSKDGTIIIHTIQRGLFMKSLRPPGESSLPAAVTHLAVGPEGQIVTQTAVGERASLKDKFTLHLYSVNGKHLASVPLDQEVTAMCVTEEFVVLGSMQCGLEIRDLQSLQAAMQPLPMRVPVHSVSVTKEKSHILVGLEDGKLIVVRPGQFHRRLWRSTRRISQVSAGETEYHPTEGKS